MSSPNSKKWLVFVDTNIFLDFYRLGSEQANRQIAALERHKESIITCEQIKMEYLKNRQKVIIDNLKQLKRPESSQVPRILTEYQPAKTMAQLQAKSAAKYKDVCDKIEKILREPLAHDAVYQAMKRLFDHDWPFNLKRPDPRRFTIRNLARKRFVLGYPPRKTQDTSIGDAINWEWIIDCAQKADNRHVLIVSRDSDYGISYGNEMIINDWLRREFKDRVSIKRDVELTNRLTVALKRLDEAVSAEDEKQESQLILAKVDKPQKTASIDELHDAIERLLAEIDSAAVKPLSGDDDEGTEDASGDAN